jgi:hypothetical protein
VFNLPVASGIPVDVLMKAAQHLLRTVGVAA